MVAARILKVVLAVVLAILLLVIMGLFTLKLINWNEHKGLLIDLTERFTDLEVERLGAINIDLYFPTIIELRDFSVTQSSATSALESAAGEFVRVSLNPLSLLSGALTIHEIRTTGTRVVLSPPQEESADDQPLSLPSIESAYIEDAAFVYRTPIAEREQIEAHIAELELAARQPGDPVALRGNGDAMGVPFRLDATAASFETLRDDSLAPIKIDAEVAGDSVVIDGAARLSGDVAFSADVRAEGNSLAAVIRPFREEVKALPPYSAGFRIEQSSERLAVTGLRLRLGESELTGEVGVELNGVKPHLRADLVAPKIRHQDYIALIPTEELKAPEEEQLISRDPLKTDLLGAFQADVTFALEEYEGGNNKKLFDRISLEAKLRDSELVVNPVQVAVAEGTIAGGLVVTDKEQGLESRGKFAAESISIPGLLAPHLNEAEPAELARGNLAAALEFVAAGRSPYDLIRDLNGGISFAVEDGSVSALAVEALGLDVSGAALAWLKGNPLTEIHCAVGVVDIEGGMAKTEEFLIVTSESNFIGRGYMDLQKEYVEFMLEGHSKDAELISAGGPIRIEGKLSDIGIDVVSGETVARLAGAALAAVAAPVLAVLPMVEAGLAEEGRCSNVRSELQAVEQTSEEVTDESSRGAERSAQ